MLIVNGLWTKAGGPAAIELGSGEIVAIMGPSGSGKSLMLRAIADLDPARGEVTLDGVSRSEIAAPEWRRRVGFIPAESGWWSDRVGTHFNDHVGSRKRIEALGLDAATLEWEVRRLSTGERHRLAIARALTLDPKVWLLDEPTAALDAEAAARVEQVILDGRAGGAAILLVTHDRGQAAGLADRVLFMKDGRLSAAGDAA